jgi:hypothetical protein
MALSADGGNPIVGTAESQATLRDLLGRLSLHQLACFKQVVVRQALWHVTKLLPPEDVDDGQRGAIAAATRWLAQPTEENAKAAAMYAVFECVDGGVRYFDYPDLFLQPAWVVGAESAEEAARLAVRSALRAACSLRSQEGGSSPEVIAHDLAAVEYEAVMFQLAAARRLLAFTSPSVESGE